MSITVASRGTKKAVARVAPKRQRSAKPAKPPARGKTAREPINSLRDVACEKIKHLIITCVFRPGEYINELQLSTMLKIGRTPIHQALDRLMVEGLVEVIPRKGVIVKPVTLNEILNIIEVRLVNESNCARLAALRADSSDLATLTDIVKRTDLWSSKRDIEQMMLLDREFHLAVAKASRNDVLAELLRGLHDRSLRFWFISLNQPDHFQSVQSEHSAIVKAILDRDPDAAEAAMRAHIESFRSNVSRFL